MHQSWDLLTFLHWKYPPSVVQPLIGEGLELDLFEDAAWVGLVPFVLRGLTGLGTFPETNVRTYVRGPGGATGVWFFSLDAARLAAVLGARATFGLPYFWSQMQVQRRGSVTAYQSRRRWPCGPARMTAEVEAGELIAPECLTELDRYLTARYQLFSIRRGRLVFAQVEHPHWPLQEGRLLRLEQNLIEAAGLPSPDGPPVVHYSEALSVRVSPVMTVR